MGEDKKGAEEGEGKGVVPYVGTPKTVSSSAHMEAGPINKDADLIPVDFSLTRTILGPDPRAHNAPLSGPVSQRGEGGGLQAAGAYGPAGLRRAPQGSAGLCRAARVQWGAD